jgi:hypothetical protein
LCCPPGYPNLCAEDGLCYTEEDYYSDDCADGDDGQDDDCETDDDSCF